MEIPDSKNQPNPLADSLAVENSALSFSFHQLAGGALAVGEVLPHGIAPTLPPLAGLDFCPEFELLLTGEGRRFAARSRKLGGCGHQFRYLGMEDLRQAGAGIVRLRHRRDEPGLEVVSCYEFFADSQPVVRRWTEITNTGDMAVGIEHLSSAVAYHIGQSQGQSLDVGNLQLHLPYSSWSGEGQWRTLPVDSLGLSSGDASHFRASCLGSRSSAEMAPMAVLEDTANTITWFWQIEHSASWLWEIGHLFVGAQHGLYLLIGGPDEEHGHWWKNLAPGETFRSIPVALGAVRGGFTEAVQALTSYRRVACRSSHEVDDGLPIIFNDYMNCLWGDPTLEKDLPLIDAAAEGGCEVFCIDAGWYAAPGEHWWPNVGEWEVNLERFPCDSFKQLTDRIHAQGMIPGLWLEAEAVGVSSPLANAPEDWFLHRHGQRILYNRRYFWNLRNPQVLEFLDGVIDRLVRDFGIGYIKNDYNIDLLQGVEDRADSFGDGLLQHTRALYSWIEGVHRRHPGLIWENCAAGGLRADYGILSRAQLQSSSDQESCADYARMVGANLALILPEQCATWCYPDKDDSPEQVAMNLVNAMCCRIHLSGRLDLLPPNSRALVAEGLEVYKSLRTDISKRIPLFPLGAAAPDRDAAFHAIGFTTGEDMLLAVWKFCDGAGKCDLEWESLGLASSAASVELRFPRKSSMEFTCDDRGIHLSAPATPTACIFQVFPAEP